MVPADRSAEVVQECFDRGIPRVWLHKGGGPSSVSEEGVALCCDHGIEVVDGACPMMFMEDGVGPSSAPGDRDRAVSFRHPLLGPSGSAITVMPRECTPR